ncbi:transketolase family protein [Iamia sp.]|uniref:transketolase family protein n=1 Tax=Iamia sp. TaxID=2722710 RepID=UPI0032C215F8
MTPGAERDAIDAVRFLAADAVERAESGHPGTAMVLAPLITRLYTRWIRHDPSTPDWFDRDRFVLSAGHASLLQYSALHLSGYDVSLDDLRSFRRLGSRTPGHPERGHTPGVEVTTGPLGQGISMAVGLAIAERVLAARFNRPGHDVVDHRTWVIAGDGDLMEGVSSEAASLAGTLGLDRLTVFYDDNHISIEGSTDLAFCEHVARRFDAYGWHVLRVDDVNDLADLDAAVDAARTEHDRPTLVVVGSHIGYGTTKQDDAAAHGLTHDSVGMGEDGPTHQPIEHLASLRAIPGLTVLRPADGNETAAAWRAALESDGPSALILSRQALPGLPTDQVHVGGAVIADGDQATILATGSEVHVALDARDLLAARGVGARVVSLPSWERFRARPGFERDQLVPPQRPTVSVEAGACQGWHEFADAVVGIDRFGLSAPGADALAETGITAEDVADAVLATLDR